MHTVFINTSQTVSPEAYRELLFEKLIEDNRLIILNDYVTLNDLDNVAVQLAAMIDNKMEIREDIRLIVYLESNILPTESNLCDNAASMVLEELYCIKAETKLTETLRRIGKVPAEILFVFGEKIERNLDKTNDIFRNRGDIVRWNSVALPDQEEVAAFLNRSESLTWEQIRDYLCSDSSRETLINGRDFCYTGLVEALARFISDNHKRSREEWSGIEVMRKLDGALSEYRRECCSWRMNDGVGTQVEYAYMTMEYRDVKERNRTGTRLMMNVYACASDPKHTFRENLFSKADVKVKAQLNGKTPETAYQLPWIHFEKLAEMFKYQMYFCEKGEYSPADAPADLHSSLAAEGEQQKDLIVSIHDTPQLRYDAKMERRWSVRELKIAVEDALMQIEEKNEKNESTIRQYLNMITAEYDRIKDEKLKKVPVTQENYETVKNATVGDDAKEAARIDNLKNVEDDISRMQRQAEKEVIQFRGRVTRTKDVTKAIKMVQRQTNDYFISLERSRLKMIAFAAFVILFVIPFVTVQTGVFQQPQGWLSFGITVAAAALAVSLGWLVFSFILKDKIVTLVKALCRDFNKTQMDNEKCLKRYTDFLYKLVPRCYGVSRYEELLHNFRSSMLIRREQITWHETERSKRIRNIRAWMDGMDVDINNINIQPDEEDIPLLEPCMGRTDNDAFYIVDENWVYAVINYEQGEKA